MPRKRKKIYIDVPYSLKNTAKTMGAMWDSDEKRWFIYDTFDFEALIKLLEENKKEGATIRWYYKVQSALFSKISK